MGRLHDPKIDRACETLTLATGTKLYACNRIIGLNLDTGSVSHGSDGSLDYNPIDDEEVLTREDRIALGNLMLDHWFRYLQAALGSEAWDWFRSLTF